MRRKRIVTPEGFLTCTRCKKDKHITEFYTRSLNVDPKSSVPSTPAWVILDGKSYGKPLAWCKLCVKDHRRGIPAGIDDLVTR